MRSDSAGTHSIANLRFLAAAVALFGCGCFGGAEGERSEPLRPVLTVGVPFPTADKPQSKLWYAHGRWWVWLPSAEGSSVFERTIDGWRLVESLQDPLKGLIGWPDVWADAGGVRAVLVVPEQISVVGLRYDQTAATYRLSGAPTIWTGDAESTVQTATISRDSTGRWWVAYDQQSRIWVRWSLDDAAAEWSQPIPISQRVGPDDLCVIVAVSDSVGVFWTDSVGEALRFRQHLDLNRPEEWEQTVVVDSGAGIADDHLNAAVGPDGTLFVVTKNAQERPGQPHLQLRIRRPDGAWEKHPYAPFRQNAEPSRPVVVLGPRADRFFLCHTLYHLNPDDSRTAHIELITVATGRPSGGGSTHSNQPKAASNASDLLDAQLAAAQATALIKPGHLVSNATTCKALLPRDAPWVVLASDKRGNVYEARLPGSSP